MSNTAILLAYVFRIKKWSISKHKNIFHHPNNIIVVQIVQWNFLRKYENKLPTALLREQYHTVHYNLSHEVC